MSDNLIIPTPDGGLIGIDAVLPQAASLAFRLATEDDEEERHRVIIKAMEKDGPTAFAFIAAAALQMLAGDVLHTILDAADAAGSTVRKWIPRMLEGYRQIE